MAYRYRTIKVNGKTKLFHRHAMEQRIGRSLNPDEHVHHEDEDPWNNSAENLALLPAALHLKEHADRRLVYPRDKACAVCGMTFRPAPSKRKIKKTCSKPCADALRSRTEKATKSAWQEIAA